MSLATTIGAGTLLGGLLAVGVYSALAPADTVNASVKGAPTYAPVPTRTVEVEAEDCVGKAVLEGDECVLHVPGPTVTIPATTQRSEESRSSSGTTSAPQTAATYSDDESESDDSGYESEDSGEDESHEDGEHEDSHEDEHDGGGEYGDD